MARLVKKSNKMLESASITFVKALACTHAKQDCNTNYSLVLNKIKQITLGGLSDN
jgi:hypothetical protein